jgi:pimeloyl-ACP methyl ester carboxylesterase
MRLRIIDQGSGVPVVLVPGVQGRWEWMRPAVEALARRCRVITFSLADEPTSGAAFHAADGFGSYLRQIADALDARHVERATICGISYGGLIAAAFAARMPERVSALVLTSAIPPSWQPDRRVRFLLRAPLLLSPLFCINSLRLLPEMMAARGVTGGLAFGTGHVWTVLTNPFSPRLMASRVRLLEGLDLEPEIARVRAPVLVLTGEVGLDRVVPVERTREYLHLWPHAEANVVARTGHLGPVTRPDAFAALVAAFAGTAGAEAERRRVV